MSDSEESAVQDPSPEEAAPHPIKQPRLDKSPGEVPNNY